VIKHFKIGQGGKSKHEFKNEREKEGFPDEKLKISRRRSDYFACVINL
jgi:hypothetical protein